MTKPTAAFLDFATLGPHVDTSALEALVDMRYHDCSDLFEVGARVANCEIAIVNKSKIGADMPKYRILGACNPTFAHEALKIEDKLGVLLPCNVIVYAGDTPGTSTVAAMDPVEALQLTGRTDIAELSQEVRARLERALADVERGAA